jgi:hypothetical protein
VDKVGPILDFVIAGFSKCGTSSVMANLAQITPMPLKDVCYSAEQVVKLAYGEWSEKYGSNSADFNQQKFLKGSKCPRYIGSDLSLLQGFSDALPHTKLVIGIRHPVLWFQSFWKMVGNGKGKREKNTTTITPNERMQMCPCPPDQYGQRTCRIKEVLVGNGTTAVDSTLPESGSTRHYGCNNECDGNMLFCLARTRFHVALAQLGKTALSKTERQLLAPTDLDGGDSLMNMRIRNPIFLYEQTMLRNESTWDELAQYLGVSHIPNTHYQAAKGKQFSGANICLPEYDYFRSQIMMYSYELSMWMLEYFLPVARDPDRMDVSIASIDTFEEMVTVSYRQDPCRRLILAEADSGKVHYLLDPVLNQTMWRPPHPEVIKRPVERI